MEPFYPEGRVAVLVIPLKRWFQPARRHGVMTDYNTDGCNMKLKANQSILTSHLKLVYVFLCHPLALAKCSKSGWHAELLHDRISCVSPRSVH